MRTRRLLPLVLAVTGPLAIAALASHGRPLTGSHGTGPTSHFFDYVFTTVALFVIAIAVVVVWSLLGAKPDKPGQNRPKFNLVQLLFSLVMVSFPVEAWRQPNVPDSGAAYLDLLIEPRP